MAITTKRPMSNPTKLRGRHYVFYTSVANTNLYTAGPSTGTNIPCAEIHVFGAGDLVVTRVDGTNVTFTGLPAGAVLPVEAGALVASGSTATNVLVIW